MTLEKYQKIGGWMCRATTITMVALLFLFILSGAMSIAESWIDILFIITVVIVAIIFLASLFSLIFFIRQAIINKIGPKDAVVTCLLFLLNIPILLAFSFVILMTLLSISGLPPQD